MPNKILTIITVVLNDPLGLERTINSLLPQKTDEIEYIVIDGDSQDQTLRIINKYRNCIDILVSEKDNGIYDAMNKGVNNSHGSHICMMNAGDTFEKDSLREVCNFIKLQINDNYAIYYGDAYFFYSNLNIKRFVPARIEGLYKSMSVSHQAVFIPQSIYKKYGSYDLNYKYAADFHFLLRLLISGEKFVRIPITIVTFATGGTSDLRLYWSRLESIRILYRLRSPKRFLGTAYYSYEIAQYYSYRFLCKIFGESFVAQFRRIFS